MKSHGAKSERRTLKRTFVSFLLPYLIFVFLLIVFMLHQNVNQYLPTEEGFTAIYSVSTQSDVKPQIAQFSDLSTIRKWGCNRSESPLIFVHIGKSGGGSVRARFAAGAENFTRQKWWAFEGDNHYYPVQTHQGIMRGKFCSSVHKHFRSPDQKNAPAAFEGIFDCHSTTPVGRMVGCPALWENDGGCLGCKDMSVSGCYTVYVGHNYFGDEIHWLPATYLQNWWKKNWASSFPLGITDGFQSLIPGTSNPIWCPENNRTRAVNTTLRLSNRPRLTPHYECSKNVSIKIDGYFQNSWSALARHENYAPIYSSLPLHRTVILREPFSWLLSRFFYNKLDFLRIHRCDDLKAATYHNKEIVNFTESGPLYQFVVDHLLQLCGNDCTNRYELGTMMLDDIERQAEANLRHGFSVVGLLNETDEFYDMITKRIQYVNMSYNIHVVGAKHGSKKGPEQERCRDMYLKNETFRSLLREALPQLQVLERLYQVGIEVNRFQKEELSQCPSS